MFPSIRDLAVALAWVVCTGVALAAPRAQHVVIISFDGGKPPVMKESAMPVFMEVAAKGAASWEAQTILPSITLVSHTSMLTGVKPIKHKILWNNYDPGKRLVSVPTVFGMAKEKGYSTAMFVGKDKFKHLEVPGTVDQFEIPDYAAVTVAKQAAAYLVEKKPNLCFIHFADGDGAGHKHGWGSEEQKQAFADEDGALKTVLDALEMAGIASETVLILTADHGGHERTHGSNSPDDMTIPWIASGKGVMPGHAIAQGISTCDTAATAMWLLDIAVPEDWDGKPVTEAFADATSVQP
jgi:predicted AlkP superfamily pyrophosphatase or phosphodiesterase